jgi:hypothetical protein
MNDCGVKTNQYMIIASYCLKDFRQITDLDVVVSINAYEKIKNSSGVKIGKAKISGDERVFLTLNSLGDDVEIEFFPKKTNQGFPSKYFSMRNLKKNKKLLVDNFGNQYYNMETCIKQYSCISKINDEYFCGDYKINKERVIKNLNHLKTVKKQMNKNIPKFLLESIDHLKNLTI